MATFELGPFTLDTVWEPLLHPRVRALAFPPVAGVDCANCRMAAAGLFDPVAKCCTFTPDLPNFLVGAIAQSGQRDGAREQVADWVEGGRATPLFVQAPPAIRKMHREAAYPDAREAIACPLLDAGGHCTIYGTRPYLCMGYHCTYPTPMHKAFWNCLSSLFALQTAIVAQYLMLELGIDGELFGAAWDGVGGEHEVWTEANTLDPAFAAKLWQGRIAFADYYQQCYRLIVDNPEGVRESVVAYRRNQLLGRLRTEGSDAALRRRQSLETQSSKPQPLEPPADVHKAFGSAIVVFADNQLSVPEHEGYVLWYHAKCFGLQSWRGRG